MNSILTAAHGGHSFFLLGQAGTGKTYLLKEIRNALLKAKKKVHVCASTGIAASQLGGKTVHSFFGLQDGRYKTEEIIYRIQNYPSYIQIKKNIKETEALIIDEISMLSNHVFHEIEAISRSIRDIPSPFGGMQVIAAGDFFQLKPVPNILNGDKGELLIEDESVKLIIPHHFILMEVHRQKEGDLIAAVQELSRGCPPSKDTIQLIAELQRPLPSDASPVRLFARNYDVDKCNSECLLGMKGDMRMYKSDDEGDLRAMKRSVVPKTLHLKVEAPVVLMANLTHNLVNGKQGIVKRLHDTYVEVQFHGINGVTCIKPYLFSVFDPKSEKNVASRKQLPLKLCYAMTVHKAQGMTYDQVLVDCRNMTVPGQIGVAIGRVRAKAGLQILNFKPSLVQPQPQSIHDFYQSLSQPFMDDCGCCRTSDFVCNQDYAPQMHNFKEVNCVEPESSAVSVRDGQQSDDDEPDDETMLQFLEFYEQAMALGEDVSLPTWINTSDLLDGLLYCDPVTNEQKELNDMVNFIKQRMDITSAFLQKVFSYLSNLFQRQINEDITNVTNIHFTTFYSTVYQFYKSAIYKSYVKELFTTEHINTIHYRVAFGIVEKLRGLIVKNASVALKEDYINKVVQSKIFKQSVHGWGVIRYIAGWCVGTLLHKKKKLVTSNLYREEKTTMVQKWHSHSLVLESLMSTEANLSVTSSDKSSLLSIKRKEIGVGNLCYVTDETFEFFKHLDATVRKYESVENVNIHGKDLYIFIFEKVQNDCAVISMWNKLCQEHGAGLKEHITVILEEIIQKYVKMSCSHFRKEYLRTLQIKKGEAHRKQIKMKQTPKNQTAAPSTSKQSTSLLKRKGEKGKGKTKIRRQKIVQWPCGGCDNDCQIDCVCCDGCDIWYHYQCVGLYGDEDELKEDQWFCFNCQA